MPQLIPDLGVILVTAALATLLFKKLKQPMVLGYLVAGLLVGPHVPLFPSITDKANIQVWSEIGVIFLLFSLGLEFSFKKLMKVGGSAGFTAILEVVFMLGLGYLVGHLLGWNTMDSLFLGAILSISSTTIIVRAFQEAGLKGQKFVDLVFGILVVEDIVAILLLVLLASFAASGSFSGWELVSSGSRLLFHVAIWFLVGIFLIPLFLRKIRRLLEDETLMLVAVGLCFLMVMIATQVGFSPALGAFVMGSLLSETPEGEKMEHVLQPIKNLFAAVFFVSVGMMIDPQVLIERWDLVILITLVTIVGKFISSFLGAFLSGQSRRQSFFAGMSLAQIGEFSFIIASLGVSLKVTSDFLYPLAIAVSAVTTFTTPYLIRYSDALYQGLDNLLPQSLKNHLDRYQATFQARQSESVASLVVRTYGLKIFLNTIMVLAVIGAFRWVVLPEVQNFFSESPIAGAVALMLCLTCSAPFLWAVIRGAPVLGSEREREQLISLRRLQVGLFVGRLVLGFILLSLLIGQFMTAQVTSGIVVAMVSLAFVSGPYWVKGFYKSIEKNFLNNLTEKERHEVLSSEIPHNILPWDTSLETYQLSPESTLCGRSLIEPSFKERYGVTVVAVLRGKRWYFAPDGSFVLWPYDKLLCFGSEQELKKFHFMMEAEKPPLVEDAFFPGNFKLLSRDVFAGSALDGQMIRDGGLRKILGGLVVGVERGSEKILGPSGAFQIKQGDRLWVVSDGSDSTLTEV